MNHCTVLATNDNNPNDKEMTTSEEDNTDEDRTCVTASESDDESESTATDSGMTPNEEEENDEEGNLGKKYPNTPPETQRKMRKDERRNKRFEPRRKI